MAQKFPSNVVPLTPSQIQRVQNMGVPLYVDGTKGGHTFIPTENGRTVICSNNPALTFPQSLGEGFSVGIMGAFTVAGSGQPGMAIVNGNGGTDASSFTTLRQTAVGAYSLVSGGGSSGPASALTTPEVTTLQALVASPPPANTLTANDVSLAKTENADVYFNGFDRRILQNIFARVIAGERVRMEINGDSTNVGTGGGLTGNSLIGGARARSWPARFAQFMTQLGIPTFFEAVMGEQNAGLYTPQTYTDFDPRLVISGGFARLTTAPCPGGPMWLSTTTGAKWSLTPSIPINAFDLFFVQQTGQGTVTIDVDGGTALQTVNLTGAVQIVRVRINTGITRAIHTINVTTTNASPVYICGCIPSDTTIGGIDLISTAVAGAFIADSNRVVANQPWYPGTAGWRASGLMAIDFASYQGTINDARSNRDRDVYAAGLLAMANIYAADGTPLMLMSGMQSVGTTTIQGNGLTAQANLVAKVADLAASSSRLYFDLSNRCGTLAEMQAKGWVYSGDNIHGTARLYGDEGAWVARTLSRLAQS